MSPPELPKQYKTPRAFEDAFKRNFRDDPARQLVLLMQRFAARVCRVIDTAVVKGGLGLEMRLDIPRTTKDADIIIAGSHGLDTRLSTAGALDLGDFLRYTVTADSRGGQINAPGMLYPGKRFKVQARFAVGSGPWPGEPFRRFTAEVSIRQPAGFDVLESAMEGFANVPVAQIRVYSLVWQIAEKVHAYTDPRHVSTTNSDLMRPRDLLDICRCASAVGSNAAVEGRALRVALEQTFTGRKSTAQAQGFELQELPRRLPVMPAGWESAFVESLRQAPLPWKTPAEAHQAAARFLDPILAGEVAVGTWDPVRQAWGE